MRRVIIVAVLAGLIFGGCGKRDQPRDAVARVGNRVIDARELNRSFGLHPQWKRGQTEFQAHLTQLDELVTQKVYALEAEKLEMDRDSLMQGYLRFLKEKEMIKGLYRQQVREKVQVVEAEARRTYEWMKRKVDFEYVFARDSAQCASYARLLASGSIGSLALPADSSVKAGRRDGARVGSFSPDFERVLFTTPLHDVKGPMRMGGGYMAVKIVGGTQEKFLSENEFNLERQKVEKLVADRKADSLSAAYVNSVMKDKDLRLNAPVFWGVAEYCFRRVKEEHLDPLKIQSVSVTTGEIQTLQDDLRSLADLTVATHREGILTVRQLMEALGNMPGSLRPRLRTPENLKAAIGLIVRNQYLLNEAGHRGLDKDPDVLFEYNLQRDETLASAYYSRRRGEVSVSPEEVEAFARHAPVSEEQVLFRFNMTALARDAKTDTALKADFPRLKDQYAVNLDTAKVRSMLKTPDDVLRENPVRIYVREIFQ